MFKFKLSAAAVAFGALFAGLSAQATPVTFTALLSGAAESPANASPGTGLATVIFDTALHTMSVNFTFSGLTGTTTAAHIHCCTAAAGTGIGGVATQTPTFAGFPLGVTSGAYANVFDMTLASSFRAGFITANGGNIAFAEQALFAGALAGKSYFNLHTSAFPGGEIRGFLSQVPEPGSLALVLLALGGIGMTARVHPSRPA
jgi:hypothetical protein